MKHSLTLYQTIRSGGDGSANATLMESQELADWDQDHLDEGWGESCTESISLESDSPIIVLDEIVSKESYLWDMIENDEKDKTIKEFITEFFPNGVPECNIVVSDSKDEYQYNNIYIGQELKHKIFTNRKDGGMRLQKSLNKYSLKPKDNTDMKVSITATEIRNKLLSAKGNFVKASWKSEPKPAAAHKGILLEKHTTAVVQAGVNFANLSAVKQGIADGTRDEVGELPFGRWHVDPVTQKSWFPHVIVHQPKGSDKEIYYLRLYPSNGINHIPKSIFYANGEEVTKEKFAEYLTPSESKKLLNPSESDKPLCFTIKLDNILGIPEEIPDNG